MLELYFKYPKVIQRLRSGALGGEMDRIAAHLFEIGYKPASAKIYISQLSRFSEFVGRRGRASTIDQDLIDRFMRGLPTAASRVGARTAIKHARRLAPERFPVPCCTMLPSEPNGALLAAYLDHVRQVRGLEPKTCEGLLLCARRILAWHQNHLRDRPLAAMTGEHVLALVQHLLSLSTNHYTRSSITSYVRTFLRFLQWSDLNGQNLARFVPRTPCRRLAHLPPRLPWEDVIPTADQIELAMYGNDVMDLTSSGLRSI